MTAEAFFALRDLILERNTQALEESESKKIQRQLQKFTKGAQTSIARGTLQQERIRSLLKTNDGAEVRRTEVRISGGPAEGPSGCRVSAAIRYSYVWRD